MIEDVNTFKSWSYLFEETLKSCFWELNYKKSYSIELLTKNTFKSKTFKNSRVEWLSDSNG